MPRIRVIVWAYVVACFCSGFLHLVDADTTSIGEVLTVRGLLSTAGVGLILMVPLMICQLAAHHRGWRGLLVAVTACGVTLGVVLALMGSTASTPGQWAVSLSAASLGFVVVMLVGAGPAVRSAAVTA